MNLIEAVKSGKLFTRPCWGCWESENDIDRRISPEDILADDYILKKDDKPKLVKWYRPTLLWNPATARYEDAADLKWLTKQESPYSAYIVVEWEEKELPEVWTAC